MTYAASIPTAAIDAGANIDGTSGSLLASTLTATAPRNRRATLALAGALAGVIAALRARRVSR